MTYRISRPNFDISSLLPATYPKYPRSPGLHVSGIIRKIAVESGYWKDDAVVFGRSTHAPIFESDMPMCIVLGLAWEDYLSRLYWEKTYRPDEICRDGIYMSPDGISKNSPHIESSDKLVDVLEEYKLTWQSTNKPIEKLFTYLSQCKSYCHAIGTLYCRLHVCYVMGNYRFGDDDGGGPQYLVYHIRFTKLELESNWQMILANR